VTKSLGAVGAGLDSAVRRAERRPGRPELEQTESGIE
jgi:hypothetical protein